MLCLSLYGCLGKNTGSEGLLQFVTRYNDILFVSIGDDSFRNMKQIKPEVKILLSSGFSRDNDMRALQKEGVLGFIKKPYHHIDLSKIFADALKS